MKLIEQFLHDLDREWKPDQEGKIPLSIIGSGALFLQTDYDRGTKDSDILETPAISPECILSNQRRAPALRIWSEVYPYTCSTFEEMKEVCPF